MPFLATVAGGAVPSRPSKWPSPPLQIADASRATVASDCQFLKSKPEHPAIEIWEGQRLVARLTKNLLANADTQHEGKIYALHGEPK